MKTFFLSLVTGFLFTSVSALAQPTTISSVPFTIGSPGVFVFGSNFNSGSGTAITITADDVTLDLGGFFLTGPGAVGGDAQNSVAISATDHHNITIRNGGVVGFDAAIVLQGSIPGFNQNYGHQVENLNISFCKNGIALRFGNQSIVLNNQVHSGQANNESSFGILTTGFADRIEHNDISFFHIGIFSSGGNFIQNNFLEFCRAALFLGGDDRRKDNVVIRSSNKHFGGDHEDDGEQE